MPAWADGVDDPSVRDDYVSDVAQFRQGFRDYLQSLDCAEEWRSRTSSTANAGLERDARVMARLHADGWNRYGWPEGAGGLGGNEIHRAAFYEELGYAMLPIPTQSVTLELMGPATLKFAPALATQYLPGYLAGTEWWGQGFSEPESSSDLASLRTRAVDDGKGGFVVNGKKIWTSRDVTPRRLLVLVRTGRPQSRHRGLTMLLVDTDTPGLSVRPIARASGRRELAELFFDDVRVPRERLVGEIDAGWGVTMFLMQFERVMYGYAVLNKLLTELGRLREYMIVHSAGHSQRGRFARAYVDVIAAQARTASMVRRLADGDSVGPESSVDRLLFCRAHREVNDLITDVERDYMMAGPDPTRDFELDTARAEWWCSRAAPIIGGAAEVKRGIIAGHLPGATQGR